MSISDMVGSLMCFLSTWPIPKGEAYLAAGTVQTCAAQGFFNQSAALCTISYNISLAVYYLLVVVKGWKEKRVEKVEKYMHAIPIVAGLGTGFTGLGLKLFNGAGWICWIASGLPNHPERHNPSFGVFRLAFLYADAWAIILFLAAVMLVIYIHVLRQEKSLDKYVSSSFASKKRKQSRKIRNQAFLYVGAMYLTWIFGSIFRLMQFAGQKPPPAIIVLFVTFFPLQGTFNLLVYMFPRINRHFEQRSLSASATASMTSLTGAKAFFSSLRQSNMEKGFGRRKGKDKDLTTTTSFTVESEMRKSTIVSTTENTDGAVGDDFKSKAEVSFVSEPIVEEFDDENEERGEVHAASDVGESSENEDDAIDELTNIVEA